MRFKNKIVLITGASRGIGRATALAFANEGAKVVVNYFSSKKEAQDVVDQIKNGGKEAIKIKCDISQEEEVIDMINIAVKTFGRIDILINNAGIVFDTPLFKKNSEQWHRTMDVNLYGTFLCSKYAAVKMLKNNFGKIVNISSTSALNDFSPDCIDYDASKAGIIALTKNFAKELAPVISVNTIAPGWVDTGINDNLSKEYIEKELDKIYFKRFAKPDEITKVVLFLASDDASFLTGSIIVADGGHD